MWLSSSMLPWKMSGRSVTFRHRTGMAPLFLWCGEAAGVSWRSLQPPCSVQVNCHMTSISPGSYLHKVLSGKPLWNLLCEPHYRPKELSKGRAWAPAQPPPAPSPVTPCQQHVCVGLQYSSGQSAFMIRDGTLRRLASGLCHPGSWAHWPR